MEEVKNEEVTEEVTQETPTVEEVAEEQKPELDLSKFESKDDDDVIKIDLSKPIETVDDNQTDLEEVIAEVAQEEVSDTEVPTIEEITDEETVTEEEVIEALDENETSGKAIPENVQKLMDFMDETGGDLNDYVNLNKDVSGLNGQDALREYYTRTKPHLDSEEIDFLIEDGFSYDEDLDDDRDIKRKKLALKEQVAEAKTYLDGQKSKYYEEIKAGSKLTGEQQKAIDFFNRYNKESEQTNQAVKRSSDVFEKRTNNLFNDKFKGFEYNVGEKKYRYNVKDVDGVKAKQSDINNLMAKFVDENKSLSDAKGYHKAIYTAMNSDAVAQHFYEQGKADALKDSVRKSKNIDMDPRGSHGETTSSGMKVRVLGDDSNSFKFKMKNKK
jgi:antitoxin component HigA of HigAB toxin-antitoxin module